MCHTRVYSPSLYPFPGVHLHKICGAKYPFSWVACLCYKSMLTGSGKKFCTINVSVCAESRKGNVVAAYFYAGDINPPVAEV